MGSCAVSPPSQPAQSASLTEFLVQNAGQFNGAITLDTVASTFDDLHASLGLANEKLSHILIVDDWTERTPEQQVGRLNISNLSPQIPRERCCVAIFRISD